MINTEPFSKDDALIHLNNSPEFNEYLSKRVEISREFAIAIQTMDKKEKLKLHKELTEATERKTSIEFQQELLNNKHLKPYFERFSATDDLIREAIAPIASKLSEEDLQSIITEAITLNIEPLQENKNIEVIANANKKGIDCLTTYIRCQDNAETSFAIASATCATQASAAWALCQGSANLVYVADSWSCDYNYIDCEGGTFGCPSCQ